VQGDIGEVTLSKTDGPPVGYFSYYGDILTIEIKDKMFCL
jgi:hypothetical protein